MNEIAREILPVNLEDEMRQSYLDYAMSVIVGRALPDVRDGLKPVHRRVLYAMRELGNDWNKAYKKSARVVGDVIGKYHPHGDSAVYDAHRAHGAAVLDALPAGRRPGQLRLGRRRRAGGHALHRSAHVAHRAASCSPTSTRKPSISSPNYDEIGDTSRRCCRRAFPNLLVNGSAGIAVGMATNIPPHNLTEVVNACLAVLDDPEITLAELMQHIPGPDFPTAGIINGAQEIATAYRTGRGRLSIRGAHAFRRHRQGRPPGHHRHRAAVPGEQGAAASSASPTWCARSRSKASPSLRDESDKDGMRVVIELKRGEVAEVVLNNLYAQTPLETVFGINMVALHRRPAEAARPQGDARGLPAAPPRSRHAPHDFRPAQGARARAHPRRPGGRARQHRRGHRAHQGVADAGRSARRR